MKLLKQEIKVEQDHALTFLEIQRILAGKVKHLAVNFFDIEKQKHKKRYKLSNLIHGRYNACAVLCAITITKSVQYHWGCLIKNKNKLYWYDSLGIPVKVLDKIMQDDGKLGILLKSHKVHENRHKHQRDSAHIKTCGLHLCQRLLNFRKTNEEYDRWCRSVVGMPLNLDSLATLMTYIGHLS